MSLPTLAATRLFSLTLSPKPWALSPAPKEVR